MILKVYTAKPEAFEIDSETKVAENCVKFPHGRARTMIVGVTEDKVWTICELIRGCIQPDPEFNGHVVISGW